MAQYGQDEEMSHSAGAGNPAFAGVPARNNEAALFVGGLSFSASEEDLRQAFGFIGHILSVRIVQDRDTGKPRGFAFVNFETPECVDTAIRECQGMELCGRNVRLDRSAAGIVGRGKGKGHFMPYHPGAEFGMYPGSFRGHAGMYPPAMMPHFAPMYPAVPYGFTAQQPPVASQSGELEEGSQQTSGGPPPPPPPPPQFMYHPMAGHPYHPMVGMPAFPQQSPAPPAPPAPPSGHDE